MIKGSVGNILADSDSDTVVKPPPGRRRPTGIQAGTTLRTIGLVPGIGELDIDGKVDGIGPKQLKSSVVKKI